ncbi:MAG: hypothetical protein ACYC4M_07590 [Thermoleophilia bacterium]
MKKEMEAALRKLLTSLSVAAFFAFMCVSPALAEKPSASIPPGTWHGSAYWTGAISNGEMSVTIVTPAVYTFEFQVEPDGTVSNGLWSTNTANVNVNVPSLGPASGTISGGGSLAGTGDFVTATGMYNISVSIPSLGISDFPVEFPAKGGFQATTASCNTVYGDLADEARQAQQAAGFSTSVMGPFTAVKIAGPGEQGVQSWEQNYVALLDKMAGITANPKPTPKEVFELVSEIEKFQANLVQAQPCGDLPSSFKKGKQPYTWFVEKYTEMLNKLLANPADYSGADISEMLFAALQLGAVGSAAPDEQAAKELEAKFKDVLGQKLDADIAAGDKGDAKLIYLAASQAGFTDLADKAHDFAFS